MCKKYFSSLFFLVFLLMLAGCASNRSVVASLNQVDQDAFDYAQLPGAHYTIKPDKQKSLAQNFLKHYFAPWDERALYRLFEPLHSIYEDQKLTSQLYSQYPGWGADKKPHTPAWIQHIVANMHFANFPNLNRPGIIINDTDVRSLPTLDPSYDTRNDPGHCYPFDNLQMSYLPAGTPIRVLHTSADGAWHFVATPSFAGWIPEQNIALVDNKFIKRWKTGDYLVPVHDQMPIFDQQGFVQNQTRIGALYPLQNSQNTRYQTLIVSSDAKHHAVINTGFIHKSDARLFPIAFSPQKVAKIANQLVGNPYGWGGLYGYRDCSASLQDLFSPFGIWLPRNSGAQAHRGHYVVLKGLDDLEKENKIMREAIPFLTLIHLPGHIMLYVGKYNGTAYVFHDMWGLHTKRLFAPSGRAVVGSTVITPIHFGRGYINVPRSLLTNTIGMTFLLPAQALAY